VSGPAAAAGAGGTASRVVFVAGAARSGTTLLGEMLGAQPRVLNVGELSLFWRDADRGNACACGAPIPSCPLWQPALERVRRELGITTEDYAGLARTRSRLARTTRPLRLGRMVADPTCWTEEEGRLVAATSLLLRAAREAAGADVVVDTSKMLPALLFHRLSRERQVDVVHLVRDPCAVAASTVRSRSVRRGNLESLPPGGSLPTAITRWLWANATLAAGTGRGRAVRVRYERLMADPVAELGRTCAAVGLVFDPRTVEGGALRTDRPSHAAVGNPRRGAEVTPLVADERWRTELPAGSRRLVRLATWPLDAAMGERR
jgi:hypothetical protein